MLAETCVFVKQSPVALHCGPLVLFTLPGHPFSRSYGVILPSSLTRVLSITLGFSPRLPVSVCGTGTSRLARGFSWQCGIRNFGTIIPSPSQLSLMRQRDLPRCQPNCLDALIQQRAYPILLRPPIAQMVRRWYRNFYLLSIAYAFRPRLRSRLTLSGRAFLRKPWAFGGGDSHPSFATHTGILTSKRSTSPYGLASQPLERSPTIVRKNNPQLR